VNGVESILLAHEDMLSAFSRSQKFIRKMPRECIQRNKKYRTEKTAQVRKKKIKM
jgi:hypothetical protein